MGKCAARVLKRSDFYICLSGYVFLHFVVYASLILDGLFFSCMQANAPDKAIKQSRDLKCVFVFCNLSDIQIILVLTEQDLKAQRTRACVRIVLLS